MTAKEIHTDKKRTLKDFLTNPKPGESMIISFSSLPTFMLQEGQSTNITATVTRIGGNLLFEEHITVNVVEHKNPSQ